MIETVSKLAPRLRSFGKPYRSSSQTVFAWDKAVRRGISSIHLAKGAGSTARQGYQGRRAVQSVQFLCAGLLLTSAAASSFAGDSSPSKQPWARSLAASMSSKLIPANPSEVMVIRNVTPNIVTLSVPFLRVGLLKIGGRATIVRMTSGSLAVFSPVALTPEVKAKLGELGGAVRYIIAPDVEHHIFVSEWATAFPDAKLIGPEGLPEKRKAAKDDKVGKEPFAVVFAAKTKAATTVDEEFDRDFAYEFVDAHPNKELVFCFRPERVLIEADLMFNMPPREQYSRVPEAQGGGAAVDRPGFLDRFFYSLQTTEGEAKGTKRFLWYFVGAKDRKGFNESVQRIHAWDFDIIIPCHGDVIQEDGKAVFEKVFEWQLAGKKA